MEEVVKKKISIYKVLMLLVVVLFSVFFVKSFLEKNIMLPGTVGNLSNVEEINKKGSVYNEVEIITNTIKEFEAKITPSVVYIEKEPEIIIKEVDKVIEKKVYVYPGVYSWYYPPLGGINCDVVNGVEECNYLANGDKWEDWYKTGAACPVEFPFGTVVHIKELDIDLICVDRGGLIYKDNMGRYWIDHLTDEPLIGWSTNITLEVEFKE